MDILFNKVKSFLKLSGNENFNNTGNILRIEENNNLIIGNNIIINNNIYNVYYIRWIYSSKEVFNK